MKFRGVDIEREGWESIEDSVLFKSYFLDKEEKNETNQYKVAAFDFDDTLVKKHKHDLSFPNVEERLKELHKAGYILAMVTNEALDHMKKTDAMARTLEKKLDRMDSFMERIQLPMRIYMPTRKDKFRKSSTKDNKAGNVGTDILWKRLAEDLKGTVSQDTSFFCGDSAGFPSDADKVFASTIGVKFELAKTFFQQPLAAASSKDEEVEEKPSKRVKLSKKKEEEEEE